MYIFPSRSVHAGVAAAAIRERAATRKGDPKIGKQTTATPGSGSSTLRYQLLRNTTSPDEKATGVQSFVANLSAFEILTLDTRENLRSYIAEYNPRQRSTEN